MATIITIPNDNDPVMNAERQRIVPWAATHNWSYTGYNDDADHIAQIRSVGGGSSLDVLDLDCHGSPTVFDHTFLPTAVQFGRILSLSTGFSGNSAIYLDACNTGLTSAFGGPIAQAVADGAGCRVYGTKGYMTGTYAENNERCYASVQGVPPYPGAQDAVGRNVWIVFQPQGFIAPPMEETMIEPSARTIEVKAHDASGLSSVVGEIVESEPVDFPMLRMAPDATVNYVDHRGVMILDVYANGGLLKDRISGLAWRVPNPERFQRLVVERLFMTPA